MILIIPVCLVFNFFGVGEEGLSQLIATKTPIIILIFTNVLLEETDVYK